MKNKREIKARLNEWKRDALVIISIIAISVLTVTSGAIEYFNAGTAYERVKTILPIIISVITVTVLLYNNFIKKAKPEKLSYLHKRDSEEFILLLHQRFGDNCVAAENAYWFIIENMNKKKGFTRWYNGEHYYVHPQGVAETLIEHTRISQEGVIVALFHDCMEDFSGAMLEKFNAMLADKDFLPGVSVESIKQDLALLSKKKGLSYRDPKIMNEYMESILSSRTATLVKIADRMNNNSSYYGAISEEKKGRYNDTKSIYTPFITKARAEYEDEGMFFSKAQEFFAQEIS